MAEAILIRAMPTVNVHSAGLGAMVGWAADPTAILLMKLRGIDISPHIAKQLSFQMAREAEIILTMNYRQKDEVVARYSFTRGRVFSLGERKNIEIVDPYQKDRKFFEQALSEIDIGVDSWLPVLKKI